MKMGQWALVATLAAVALSSAACTTKGGTTNVTTAPETPAITVSGHGEVVVRPDTGLFDVGVQASAASVAQARDQAATAANAVIKSVKGNGVDEKDVQTTQLSIQPQYFYPQNGGEPRITGYQVINTVSVKVRKLESFSKIIDDAAAAGGDNTVLQGVRFGLEDDKKALEQAREAAVADAKQKAEQLAKLGGVKLGDPQAISEVNVQQPKPVLLDLAGVPAAPRSGPGTPIETGSGKLTLDVQVRWAIAK